MKTESLWTAVVIWPNGSTHLVSRSLLEQTIDDLAIREAPPTELIPVDHAWTFDKPGMVWANRKMLSIKIDTLELHIPAMDLGWFLQQIRKLPLRTYRDGSAFYKLHAFSRCVVLTPDQKETLQREFEYMYEKSRDIAEDDFQEYYSILKDLGEKGVIPKVKLMSKDTSKN